MVGASGVFAPLVKQLVAEGAHVLAVSRHPDNASGLLGDDEAPPSGGSLRIVETDTTTAEGVSIVTGCGPVDYAVLYRPALTAQTLAAVTSSVRHRAVLVLTSEAAAPSGPVDEATNLKPIFGRHRPRSQDALVLLGWKSSNGGPSSWHSPREISTAALQALEGCRDVLVGQLRPWAQRPR